MKPISSHQGRWLWLVCAALLSLASAPAQTAPAAQPPAPVSYGSSEQLNQLLARLDQASQSAQVDLAKLRIDKWKTDSTTKRQTQDSVDSITRNLKDALPGVSAELRAAPENLGSTFKLYRNLEALYDVFRSVAESTGAFGSKDDFQALENDLDAFEAVRRGFADRMETLAVAKQSEVDNLRMQLQKAQAATTSPSETPKKTVVDDTAPPKKAVKKKPAAKTTAPAAGTGTGATPSPAPPK